MSKVTEDKKPQKGAMKPTIKNKLTNLNKGLMEFEMT
jgi:hypothetical protein